MTEIILASNSPRRKEILSNAGYNFKVIASCYDEKIQGLNYTPEIVINCAYQKALEVSKKYPDSLVIGADTVVVFNNTILGKPHSETEAYTMLESLSNNTHFVATAVCIIKNNKVLSDIEITYVTFRSLSNEEIVNYLNSKKPYDKAGSYGIQDEGFDFAISINGELDNVIGFPINLFEKLYNLI